MVMVMDDDVDDDDVVVVVVVVRDNLDEFSPFQPCFCHQRGGTVYVDRTAADRKSTRLNSSHGYISYAVFCLKKKTQKTQKQKQIQSVQSVHQS